MSTLAFEFFLGNVLEKKILVKKKAINDYQEQFWRISYQ